MAQIPLINPKLINRTPVVTSPQGDSPHSTPTNSDAQTPLKSPPSPSAEARNLATKSTGTENTDSKNTDSKSTEIKNAEAKSTDNKQGNTKATIFAAQVVRNTKTENGEYQVEIKGLQQGRTLTLTSKQPIEVGTKLLIQSELVQPKATNTEPKIQLTEPKIQLKVLATLITDSPATANPKTTTQGPSTLASTPNTGIQTLQQFLPQKSALPNSAQLLIQNRASLQSPNLQNEIQQIRQFLQSPTHSSSLTLNQVKPSPVKPSSEMTSTASLENKTLLSNNSTSAAPKSNSIQAQLDTLKQIAKQAPTAPSATSTSHSSTIAPNQSISEVNGAKLDQLQQQLQQWIKDLPKPHDLQSAIKLPNIMQQTGNVLEGKLAAIAAQQLSNNESKQSNPLNQPLVSAKKPSSANQLFSYLQKTISQLSTASPNVQKPVSSQQAINIQHALGETEKLLEQQIQQALANSSSTPLSSSAQQALLQDNKHIFASLLLAWFKPKTAANDKNSSAQTSSNSALQQIPNQWPQQNLPAALKSIQSILSRIEHEQIQQSQDTQNQQWLPIFYQEKQQPRLLELEYFKEQVKEKNAQSHIRWHIRLHLELEKIGKLGIELKLINQELSTVFWSTESSTLQQLQNETRPLRVRLQEKGFIVNDLIVQRGELTKKTINFQQHLVDVNT